MTKMELVEAWFALKGDQPYTLADLVSIVDTASRIGADLQRDEIIRELQEEIKFNSDVNRNPESRLGELVIPNVGLMEALRIVYPVTEDD